MNSNSHVRKQFSQLREQVLRLADSNYVNKIPKHVNSFCIAIDNRKVPINIRSLYDTENCYDHHTNGIGHAELRVQLLKNPSLYGSLQRLHQQTGIGCQV